MNREPTRVSPRTDKRELVRTDKRKYARTDNRKRLRTDAGGAERPRRTRQRAVYFPDFLGGRGFVQGSIARFERASGADYGRAGGLSSGAVAEPAVCIAPGRERVARAALDRGCRSGPVCVRGRERCGPCGGREDLLRQLP